MVLKTVSVFPGGTVNAANDDEYVEDSVLDLAAAGLWLLSSKSDFVPSLV